MRGLARFDWESEAAEGGAGYGPREETEDKPQELRSASQEEQENR